VMEYVLRYRRKVADSNLLKCFPELTPAQRRHIRRRTYLNLTDVTMETVKLISISKRQLERRMRLTNPEVIPQMVAHGAGGIAIFAHYANWEWLGSGMGNRLPFGTVGVYKPQRSRAVDRLMLHIRSRMGNHMISIHDTYRESLKLLKEKNYIAFVADQTPIRSGKLYFTSFFGHPTAYALGIARIALKLKCPVYYFDIQRVRRGQYEVTFRHLPLDPYLPVDDTSQYRMTDAHAAILEEIVRRDPSQWIWTHRRWKRVPREGDIFSDRLAILPPQS
jgi:Kdo2-lipid IVA lauroyltransferase/acyltransferase